MQYYLILVIATAGFVAGCDRSTHEEHDYAEDTDPISVTVFTPKLELFMEYPHLVQGHSARFLAHFSVLKTGEPIKSGRFVLEARSPGGATMTAQLDAPKRDGLYTPEMTFPAAGEYDATITVDSPQVSDSIPIGKLLVHSDHDSAMKAAEAGDEDVPPNAVPFLLEQQWKVGTLLHTVNTRSMVERLRCAGEIVAPAGAAVVASSPIAGRILRPPDGKLPRLGDRVDAGQVLARIEPPTSALTDVAVRALALQTTALEIDRTLREAAAKLDFAKRAVERQTSLRTEGVVSERQFDEARRNLEVAEAEHASAVAMKSKYEAAAKDLALLQEAAKSVSTDSGASDLLRVQLISPISGHISAADRAEGEQIDAHDPVFRILNLDSVWVVTRLSEFDLPRVPEQPNAVVAPSAYPDRTMEVVTAGGRLVHFGTVVDPASRTVSLTFELPNRDRLFRAGMLADVFLETQKRADAVAIPESAVVMEGGRPIAFVLLDGELFQKRELTMGLRDSGFVEVREGISAGERVVSRGAYAIKLAALSGAAFGPGHVH